MRDKANQTLHALKVLKKDYIIKKNQVEHTKTERSVLGYVHHPFIVGLTMAFQVWNSSSNLLNIEHFVTVSFYAVMLWISVMLSYHDDYYHNHYCGYYCSHDRIGIIIFINS